MPKSLKSFKFIIGTSSALKSDIKSYLLAKIKTGILLNS